jgi:hypothetical protein
MRRFLFFLRDRQQRQGVTDDPSADSGIRGLTQWVSELALSGNYLWGEALDLRGSYVGKEMTSKKQTTGDSVVGCFLIQAENVDQAGAIAQDCPAVMSGAMDIEVRPVIEVAYD